MKFASSMLVLISLAFASVAQATVFKCVDAQGRVTYTNDRSLGKGCTALKTDVPVSSIPAPARTTANPPSAPAPAAGFPRVSPDAQRARDDTRRQILEHELAAEQAAMDEAQAALNAQTTSAENNDAAPPLAEALQPHQDKVELHERNIEALRRELGSLR
jgi:hypothetical protein